MNGSTTSWLSTTQSYNDSTNSRTLSCPPKSFPDEMLFYLKIDRWCLGLEFFFAILGNICVLALLWRRRENWSKMHLFILHLSIADLLVAFFLILPEWLIRMLCGFHAGDLPCRLHKFMQIVGMYGSTFVLLAAALDRYRAICHPMKSFRASRKRVHVTVAAMWILSALLSSPQLFVFEKNESSISCVQLLSLRTHSYFNKIYVTWYFMVILVIPTILLVYLYGMIAVMIMRNLSQKKRAAICKGATKEEGEKLTQENGKRTVFTPRASSTTGISRAKIKTVKMTVVIVVTYILCWAPFFVVQMLVVWGYKVVSTPVNIFQILACVNSCTNPWIYMCFSGNLYEDLKRFICCIKQKPKSFNLKPRGFYANQSGPNSTALLGGSEQTGSCFMESPILKRKPRNSEQMEMTEFTTTITSA